MSPSPKKKAKEPKPEKVEETPKEPEMAPKASDGLQSVAEPGQESHRSQASEPGGKKPVKAGLPPPGKEVWKDVHTQVMKLSKEGKPALRNAWEKASQAGSQQAKREFYYNVFLLDPNVSQKAVHKESLERLQEKETTTKGWMTAYQIGVLQGADPLDPDFKELCTAACEGLKERPHEVEKWAAKGMKQYYVQKELNTEETRVKESSTKALQSVDGLEAEDFHQIEKALSVNSQKKQFLLGGKKPVKAVEEPEKAAEEEETEGQKYVAALKAAKKALASLGSAVDRASFLLKQMEAKQPEMAPNAQLESSISQLKDLESKNMQKKNDHLKELSSYKAELEQPEMAEQLLKGLAAMKKSCEDELKVVQKDLAPHKLWARNVRIA